MAKNEDSKVTAAEVWGTYLNRGYYPESIHTPWFARKSMRPLFRLLPSEPRCPIDYYPFQGIGGALVRLFLGITPSKMNPRLCNLCDQAAKKYQGGAEVETSLLFADIRGSTSIAETMKPADFSELINRFYDVTTKVVINTNGMIEKLVGDEVTAFYVPGIAGPEHAGVAVEAARMILGETQHGSSAGPWVPVGVGIHTGKAWIGSVRSEEGMTDIAVLGDVANVAARLASQAGPGEILISEATRSAAGVERDGLEFRHLALKGRAEPVDAWILRS